MHTTRFSTLTNGFALFSMFFGAGNITFPLLLGLQAGWSLPLAILGFIITAVLVPFSGLIAISLHSGKYKDFFYKLGKVPGFLIITFLIALIGPFVGIPRCITLTYSTLSVIVPKLSLFSFSLAASLLISFACARKSKIIKLIGNYLTPILLTLLTIIIIKGIFFAPKEGVAEVAALPGAFRFGLIEGYNTMDLLAAFFFGALVCDRIKVETKASGTLALLYGTLKASLVGAVLLTAVYVGFSTVAVMNTNSLQGLAVDKLLGTIGNVVLGEYAGAIVCLSVALTCLTTALALATISADFLRKEILGEKISHAVSVLLIMGVAFMVSLLGFSSIIALFGPMLQYLYPLLLVFSLLSIGIKIYNLKPLQLMQN